MLAAPEPRREVAAQTKSANGMPIAEPLTIGAGLAAPTRRGYARHAAWMFAGALIVLAAIIAHDISMHSGLRRLMADSEHRLDVIAAEVEGELARFQYLPSLLDAYPSVSRLLDSPHDMVLQDEVNHHLQLVNNTAGSAILYVVSPNGDCIAASDWNEPGSPFGANLAFRPYVRDALERGRGRFFGIGFTTKRAGYYLSYALNQNGRPRGVATVKVSLEKIEHAWNKLPGNVLVFDQRGVVILASQPHWRYRPAAPLSAQTLADIATARPYADEALKPLNWEVQDTVSQDVQIVSLDRNDYVVTTRHLDKLGWELRVLAETTPLLASARSTGLLAALAMTVLWLLVITLWQRQRALRHRIANQQALQAAYDGLEAMVVTRTAELCTTNACLAAEIETRKSVEADLLRLQGERMHAAKMVALGQMSAGVAHELNQPLGALRILTDNTCVLLHQSRLDEVRGNLERIGSLIGRLGGVTCQLKAFAHKAELRRSPVSLQQVIANAQFLVSPRLQEHDIEVQINVSPNDLAALADPFRLEQVMVNILGNAIDAMSTAPVRRLIVKATAAGDRCVVSVTDTGPGIRADILPHLFEPFNTSKPTGAGLGLGLMISAHNVGEFGGRLHAKNIEHGGACFIVELPSC